MQNCSHCTGTGSGIRPIVSYCVSPVPCTCPVPVQLQCERAITSGFLTYLGNNDDDQIKQLLIEIFKKICHQRKLLNSSRCISKRQTKIRQFAFLTLLLENKTQNSSNDKIALNGKPCALSLSYLIWKTKTARICYLWSVMVRPNFFRSRRHIQITC